MTNPNEHDEVLQAEPSDDVLVRIVDDDAELLDALGFMLSCEGWRVKTYPDARSFLTQDMPSVPGVLILDQQMPGMQGAELQAELDRRGYGLPIIFLTAHGSVDLAVRVLRSGAFHFLLKPVDAEALMRATAEAVEKDLRRRGRIPDRAAAVEKLSALTAREHEVAKLLAEGLLNKQIAERLGLSVRTVEVYRAASYRKLDVKSAAELARLYQVVKA